MSRTKCFLNTLKKRVLSCIFSKESILNNLKMKSFIKVSLTTCFVLHYIMKIQKISYMKGSRYSDGLYVELQVF